MKISSYLVSHHGTASSPDDGAATPTAADGPEATRFEPARIEALLGDHGFSTASSTAFSGLGYAGTRRALTRTTPEGPDADRSAALLDRLAADSAQHALVPASLIEAPRKLLVMDVDSTLIRQEVIELLAAHAGREAEVAAVTEAAMRGELDFSESLHARVATLAGLEAGVIDRVCDAVVLSAGARELIAACHEGGHLVGVVSGGFLQILRPLADGLGLDFARANDLGVSEGR
ncbi:MAG: HAD-IB family phosphatase, partial [Micrococcaceae bacterium]|nr:HAD-IB family phosphatase [Micrococcaceae bacterium]